MLLSKIMPKYFVLFTLFILVPCMFPNGKNKRYYNVNYRMFQHVPLRVAMFLYLSVRFGTFRYVLIKIRTFYTKTYENVPNRIEFYVNLWKRTVPYSDIHVRTKMNGIILVGTK